MAIVNEDFSGITPPSIPGTITADSGIDTVASAPINTNNALRLTGTTTATFWESVATGNADGNDYYRLTTRSDATGRGLTACQTFSVHSSMLAGAFATTGIAYFLQGRPTDIDLQLYVDVSGTVTLLKTLGVAADFSVDVNYVTEIYRAFDANGDGWIQVYIQRLSDLKYYRTTQAVWDDGKVYAFDVKHNGIGPGASKVGGEFANSASGNTTYHDDVFFDRAKAIGLHCWGDSLTLGTQASGGGYPLTLGAIRRIGTQNHGDSGHQAIDIVSKQYATAFTGHAATIVAGMNDATDNGYGSNTTKRDTYFARALQAGAAAMALPTKTRGAAGTGSNWATGSGYDGAMLKASITSAAVLTFAAIAGATIFLSYSVLESYTGTAAVKVDGVTQATIDCTGAGCTTTALAGQTYGPQLLILSSQGAGSHTVTVTCNDTGGVAIDWVAGSEDQASLSAVQVGTITHVATAAVSVYFPTAGNAAGANARIDGYNTAIAAAVSSLATAGLPVTLVDLAAVIDPATMLEADGLHWNNAGHQAAAEAFAGNDRIRVRLPWRVHI